MSETNLQRRPRRRPGCHRGGQGQDARCRLGAGQCRRTTKCFTGSARKRSALYALLWCARVTDCNRTNTRVTLRLTSTVLSNKQQQQQTPSI